MAKEDYLEGYGQGLKRGKEGPVMGPINKALDVALGNPHESAKRGLEQGYAEMKAAKRIESDKDKIINKTDKEVAKFDENYKKGGKVKAPTMTFETYTKTGKKAGLKTVPVKKMASGGKVSQLAKANGIAVRGKSRGKIC